MKKFKQHWRGLSPIQKQNLVNESGLSMTYISQIANGHVTNIKIDTIKKLTGANSKIRTSWFFED